MCFICKAKETMEELAFLSQSDPSIRVKQAAKEALFTFGMYPL